MDNTFQHAINIKVDKVANIVHLSIRTSEYKVEVFKLPLGDMSSMISQFSSQMNTKESLNGINAGAADDFENNENNEDN